MELGFVVVCSPYYTGQSNLGFYQQYPAVPGMIIPGPGGFKRRTTCNQETLNLCQENNSPNANKEFINQETLNLFPLHPTGVLQEKTTSSSSSSTSAPHDQQSNITTTTCPSNSVEANCFTDLGIGAADQRPHPVFNFLCRN